MKKYGMLAGMGILAAASMAAAAASVLMGAEAGVWLLLPLTPIAEGLRRLSLSGAAGNILAWILFGLCALAVPAAVYAARRRIAWRKWDAVLWIGSVFVCLGLYGQINPGMWNGTPQGPMMGMLHSGMAGIAYMAFAVLELERGAAQADSGKLARHLGLLITILMALCTVSAFGFGTEDLLRTAAQVKEANTDPSVNLIPTFLMLGAGWLVQAVCCALDIRAGWAARELCAVWEKEEAERVEAAQRLCGIAGRTLRATAMLMLLYQGAQVVLAPILYKVQLTLQLPIVSMIALVALLLVSKLLASHKTLREENEGFI